MKDLFLVGFLFLIVGIILILFSLSSGSEGKIKFAFGGFIGPIPFGFANSPAMLKIVIIISVITLISFLLFLKFFYF
ncbi:MAG: hypothetical protein DRP10_02075 [Candidatus Aenigmatarchaeota archaeon]|nr:MAG: hypothetical protein DRP10_02075 [Candidatus Aenigmarchaeota archaeon]